MNKQVATLTNNTDVMILIVVHEQVPVIQPITSTDSPSNLLLILNVKKKALENDDSLL